MNVEDRARSGGRRDTVKGAERDLEPVSDPADIEEDRAGRALHEDSGQSTDHLPWISPEKKVMLPRARRRAARTR
jgi:hypothetical protein